jgi:hypothetical protein
LVERTARENLKKEERLLRLREAKLEKQRKKVRLARKQLEWALRQNARLADDPVPVEED